MTTAAAPGARRRKKKAEDRALSYRPAVGALHLRQGAAEVGYWLDRLDAPAGCSAFRLTKIVPPAAAAGGPGHYDVLLGPDPGADSCECLGWLRWRHCKHRDALRCLVQRGSV